MPGGAAEPRPEKLGPERKPEKRLGLGKQPAGDQRQQVEDRVGNQEAR